MLHDACVRRERRAGRAGRAVKPEVGAHSPPRSARRALQRAELATGGRTRDAAHLDHAVSGLDRQQQTRSLPRAARRVGGVCAQRLLQQATKEVEVEAERDRHRQGEQPSLSHAQAAAARAGERLAVDVQHHGYGRDPPQRKGEEEEAGAEQLGPRAEEVHLWQEQKNTLSNQWA